MAQQHESDLLRMLEEAVSAEKKDAGRIVEHFHECRGLGIEILPLDINRSEASCVFEDGRTLRLGFSVLEFKDAQFFDDLVAERQKGGPFQSFQDFCERFDSEGLPHSFFIQSIKAGVFDSLGESRARLFKGFERVIQAVRNAKAEKAANQISLFAMLPAASQGKALTVSLPEAEAWSEEQRVEYEKDALGFSFTEYLVQREQEQPEDSEAVGESSESEGMAETEQSPEVPETASEGSESESMVEAEQGPKDSEAVSEGSESEGMVEAEQGLEDSEAVSEGSEPESMLEAEQGPEDSEAVSDGAEPDGMIEAEVKIVDTEAAKPEVPNADIAKPQNIEPDVSETALAAPQNIEDAVAPFPEETGPSDSVVMPDYYREEPPLPPEAFEPGEMDASFMQEFPSVPSSVPEMPETLPTPEQKIASSGRVCLRLPVRSTTEAQLLHLRSLCEKHPGQIPLSLEFSDDAQRSIMVHVHEKFYVRDNESLRKEIQALFEGVDVLREM